MGLPPQPLNYPQFPPLPLPPPPPVAESDQCPAAARTGVSCGQPLIIIGTKTIPARRQIRRRPIRR